MCIPKIYESVIELISHQFASDETVKHLDIGAGEGELIERMEKAFRFDSEACDYHVERFRPADRVKITRTDLNSEPLPYPDSGFKLVTSSEVVEHLENPRRFFREIARVLEPGGAAVLTTPNTLNLKSRVKYLATGFFNLFDPLPPVSDEKFSADSHISPMGAFYVAHGLDAAGLEVAEVAVDRFQKTSVLWLLLFCPLILIYSVFFYLRSKRKGNIRDKKINFFVKQHFSLKLMLGRTVIMAARKPGNPGGA